MNRDMFRGEIYFADLGSTVGCEQNGVRPVIILQNNIGNHFSPTTIVAPLTSKKLSINLQTHVMIPARIDGLKNDSTILLEQIRVIDKSRLDQQVIYQVDKDKMAEIEEALLVVFGINQKGGE